MPPETSPRDAPSPRRDPPFVPAEAVLATVHEGYGQTARKVLRKIDDHETPPREFALGERFPLLGEARTVVASTQRDQHAVVEDTLVLAEPHAGRLDVRAALADLYHRLAGRWFADRVQTHANRMGVRTPAVEPFDAPTRLVECSPRPPVGLNWRAVMAPPEVVDHAAVHALAHLQADAHTAEFRRILDRHRPEFEYGEWLDSGGIALRLPP